MSDSIQTALKAACALMHRPFRISPYERVVRVMATETTVSILTEYITVEETSREWRVIASGRALSTWTVGTDESAPWDYQGRLVVPNEAHQREVHLKWGEANTPARVRAAREFARECYRPGTDQSPMDSYGRTLEGYSPMAWA